MCGICGVAVNSEQGISRDRLVKMNTTLQHRGPDEEGYFIDGGIRMGMRRLKVIDLDTGSQPIYNEDKSIVVVFNGEIYNYSELRDDLIKKGHEFFTRSDTEVIAHLYEEKGIKFVESLRGMFAIALWDRKKKRLLLVRDRLGIKPVYFAPEKGKLIFASGIKSILASGLITKEINLEAFDAYFTYNYIPAPLTIYQGIYQLLPGQYLEWQQGNFRTIKYWQPDFSKSTKLSEPEIELHLEDLIRKSLKYRLISDVPLGAFLSGGLDSTTVVAFMREAGANPIKTFSLGFDVKKYDELQYARVVAKHFATDHNELRVKPDMFDLLPKLVWHLEQPFADDSMLPTYLVSKLARSQVTVSLSGDGGDELFAGYDWTSRYQYSCYLNGMPEMIKRSLRLHFDDITKYYRASGKINALRRFLYDSSLSLQGGFERRTTNSLYFRRNLYSPWVINELKDYNAVRLRDPVFSERVKNEKEWMLLADLNFYLPDDILFKVDRMSMANSLEARVPLLDHKLVEFAASIPFDLKIRGLTTKFLLKKILKKRVPGQILKQRKQGFSLPVGNWLREGLREIPNKMLFIDKDNNFFNQKFVSWLLAEHQSGRQEFGSQFFSILVFLLWHKISFQQDLITAPTNGIEQYFV